MKLLNGIVAAAVVAGSLTYAFAEELSWQTDLPKAQAQAKKEKKTVMLNFTGSDWCVWCTRLKSEIFSKEEFKTYADKHLILVEVDFPRKKEQSAEQKKANQTLQEKYAIEGYPTLIILDSDGKPIGRTGYIRGGPKPFLENLETIRKKAA